MYLRVEKSFRLFIASMYSIASGTMIFLNEDGLDVASLTEESREALANTGGVVADTTTRAVTLLVTNTRSTVRAGVGTGSRNTCFSDIVASSVTLSSSTTVQRIVVRGALLEGAVGTTETKVTLASIVLVRVPSSVVRHSYTSEGIRNTLLSGTSNSTRISGEAGSRKASSVTRALVGAGSTGASLTFVSGEALALTSGSVAKTLTSTLDNVVGTVSIPLTEIASDSVVGDGGRGIELNRLRVDLLRGGNGGKGLIGGDGNHGSRSYGETLDGVESIDDSDLGTSAEVGTSAGGSISSHIIGSGDGDDISTGSDSSGHSPLLAQTIRSGSREGVSLGASSLGAISTSPGSILISSQILTDVVSTSGTSIGVASAGILRAALTMSRAEVGAVGRDGGNCSSDEHQCSLHSVLTIYCM